MHRWSALVASGYSDVGGALRVGLVGAYRGHVLRVARTRGAEGVPGLDEAIERGAAWLEAELSALLGSAFPAQRRGPLEVFQEAMRFPTEALAGSGVLPISRDEATMNALPGDVYGFAPSSSSELGEDVWRLHMAWGAAKAAAMQGR
ncbi:MAG: hypothetical protein OEX04_09425 [Acidimicrobiia bacterium]|nr:hypothetical protein [Acidimicrobiia bacterium]MDH4307686.1 hypothetical protein [Acidimicrobiia bacterium]MDH5295438.1 hypothetical protein [Acidimicrobiia bacterium]